LHLLIVADKHTEGQTDRQVGSQVDKETEE
jgi:hypothetical protein